MLWAWNKLHITYGSANWKCLQLIEQQLCTGCVIHQKKVVPDSFTIFVANNIDRQEETCQVCVFWLSLFNVCFHSLSLNYIYAMCSWLLPIIVLRKNVKGVLVSYTIQFLKNLIRKEILKFYRQGKTTFRTGKVFR